MIRISINTRTAYLVYTEAVTAGSSGIECEFSFSAQWDGISKMAVFSGSGAVKNMPLTGDDYSCIVPYEAVTTAGGDLRIGVYGTDGTGNVIIPTIWVSAGKIREAVVPPCKTEPTPTASVIDQLLAAASNAVDEADAEAKAQAELAEGYAQDAKTSSEIAEHYYELAEQVAVGKGFVWFDIGDDGHLYMTRTANLQDGVDAEITEDGRLEIILS